MPCSFFNGEIDRGTQSQSEQVSSDEIGWGLSTSIASKSMHHISSSAQNTTSVSIS